MNQMTKIHGIVCLKIHIINIVKSFFVSFNTNDVPDGIGIKQSCKNVN